MQLQICEKIPSKQAERLRLRKRDNEEENKDEHWNRDDENNGELSEQG